MEEDKYIKIIEKTGLVCASSRKFFLLMVSSFFYGYSKILKKRVGYSYKNLATLGKNNQAINFINESDIGKEFETNIGISNLYSVIADTEKNYVGYKNILESMVKNKDNFKTLNTISKVLPEILAQLGFYRSVMRYVKNDQEKVLVMGKNFGLVEKNMNKCAEFLYGMIEPLLVKTLREVSREYGVKQHMLEYLTLREFKEFIKNRKISKKKISDLLERKRGYFYLYYDNKESLVTNLTTVRALNKKLFNIKKHEENFIKGICAYPGKAKGAVYKVFHGINKTKNIKTGQILVTNITKPNDTPYLKKFSAIVADEGGLLSHTSITAREFKIPCIIGTKIATKVLSNGDLVEVDAERGVVKILKKE